MIKYVSPSEYYSGKEFFLKEHLPLQILHMDHSIEYPVHSHDFTEIVVVYSGEAVHCAGNNRDRVAAGSVLLLPVGLSHSYEEVDDFSYVNIIFDSGRLISYLPPEAEPLKRFLAPGSYKKMSLCSYQTREVLSIVSRIDRELFRDIEISGILTISYFLQFMGMLYEGDNRLSMQNLSAEERVREVVSRIDSNVSEDCSIEALAGRSAMSPRSFHRLFRSLYGKTPSVYINEKRVEFSSRLLKDTDLTITQIASLSGYDDPNYFSHQFKSIKGISPRVFRGLSTGPTER
ncbi:MAG: AraC family transcriptional regulator [Spirochaetales bacterium]|nr:AraC family transcriptional regulator [Spirochaetales bacterium]